MERDIHGNSSPTKPKWRKVAYGGMQPGFDDNHTDESFLEDMVMNANVVKRDILKEYKFEINGPWDEAKLCFDITDCYEIDDWYSSQQSPSSPLSQCTSSNVVESRNTLILREDAVAEVQRNKKETFGVRRLRVIN